MGKKPAARAPSRNDLRGALMVASPNPADLAFIGTNAGSEKEPLDRLEFVSVNRYTGASYDINKTDVVRGIDVSKVSYWIESNASMFIESQNDTSACQRKLCHWST